MSVVSVDGARAVITGGAGLIGSHLAELLLEAGAGRVVVLDDLSRGTTANLADALRSDRCELVVGDIGDRRLLAEVVGGADLLFHMAALRLTRCADEPRRALEVMVDGTFDVVEAAVGAGVARVVASSSASIYGDATSFPTAEDHHPYGNRTLYGAAKLFNEGLLASFEATHGLSYVALRYFNVYGPRMDVAGAYTEVLVRWMERIEAGEAPVVFGDGSDSMDFVFVGDVARANLLAATAPVSGRAYNIASGVETSLLELAKVLLDVMGSDLAVEHGPPRAAGAVARRLADTRAAARDLGFTAEVDLADGIERLVHWWRAQRAVA